MFYIQEVEETATLGSYQKLVIRYSAFTHWGLVRDADKLLSSMELGLL
jgi:hypothetical protein